MHREALPPLSEEDVIRGLIEANKDVDLKWKRHTQDLDDPSYARFQQAGKLRAERAVVVLNAKSRGELPNIGVDISDDSEVVSVILPPQLEGEKYNPMEFKVSSLVLLDSHIRDLFPGPEPIRKL
jgi:hypothetical protein